MPSSLSMMCDTKPTGFILVHLYVASLLDGLRIVHKHSVLPSSARDRALGDAAASLARLQAVYGI